MTTQSKPTRRRTLAGRVVTDAMAKTIVVVVERTRLHPKYEKRYRTSRRFKVHDEENAYRVGDWVQFVETRPLSREKRWTVVGKAPDRSASKPSSNRS
jgi:small subunit ribosomal protein S17